MLAASTAIIPETTTESYSPEFFCRKGIGYILAKHFLEGLANCEAVTSVDNDSNVVFWKMVWDGKIIDKFADAHTQLGYLCWLKAMDVDKYVL